MTAGCVLPFNLTWMGKDMGTPSRRLGYVENSGHRVVVSRRPYLAGKRHYRSACQNLFNLLQEEVVPPEETEEDNESVLKKLLRKGGNAPHAKAE